jgi:pimeloyl-ACP methyl ester carboxylesterase
MKECVILLHGMGRTKRSMRRLERRLSGQGYRTVNLDYPSLSLTIEEIADVRLAPVVERCGEEGCGRIHFVTHSLGGIVVRRFLQTHEVPAHSRMVMLAPPNQGSELADILSSFFFYRRVMGPAAQQLGTGPDSLPNRLGPAPIETGIITGAKGLVPFASWLFQGPNDGKVSVERARLAGMRDFLVMPCGHSFIMRNPAVLFQVVHFLQYGRFSPP